VFLEHNFFIEQSKILIFRYFVENLIFYSMVPKTLKTVEIFVSYSAETQLNRDLIRVRLTHRPDRTPTDKSLS